MSKLEVLMMFHELLVNAHVCVGEKRGVHEEQDKVVDYDLLMKELGKRILDEKRREKNERYAEQYGKEKTSD